MRLTQGHTQIQTPQLTHARFMKTFKLKKRIKNDSIEVRFE